MEVSQRIAAFGQLGDVVRQLGLNEHKALAEKAQNENAWFTEGSVALSLKGIEVLLDKDRLASWASAYSFSEGAPKVVGVAMAGNLPAVGFHDFLCVLISGHQLKAKPSSQDSVLIKFLGQKLQEISPELGACISFEDTLKNVDAMIATGSDNTARYFEYYFRNIPHIIRKNRASCAVLVGEEPAEELHLLGKDVFSYFGLGCRNVSKVFVPEEFDVTRLLDSWASYAAIGNHHKYANNYDYQKSILLVNQAPFLDSGFLILRKSTELVSPIATLFYETYQNQQELKEKLQAQREKLQVIVSAKGWFEGSVPFGEAQFPKVNDYADDIDTLEFLTRI